MWIILSSFLVIVVIKSYPHCYPQSDIAYNDRNQLFCYSYQLINNT